jgi:hypothetical protein
MGTKDTSEYVDKKTFVGRQKRSLTMPGWIEATKECISKILEK